MEKIFCYVPVSLKEKRGDTIVLEIPLPELCREKVDIETFINDITLRTRSFAEENQSEILKRRAERIIKAKKRGVRFGRPQKPLPEGFEKQYSRWVNGEITLSEGARQCGMPISTFSVKAKKIRDKGEDFSKT